MPITIPPPDGPTIQSLFPISRPPPAPGVFELGLVLGGTVAAGAYTAGALDCLLEVLEGWYSGPRGHEIAIPLVAGASGGAMCAAFLGSCRAKRCRM
jgi:predicted acylesterase/phospholipase RssA